MSASQPDTSEAAQPPAKRQRLESADAGSDEFSASSAAASSSSAAALIPPVTLAAAASSVLTAEQILAALPSLSAAELQRISRASQSLLQLPALRAALLSAAASMPTAALRDCLAAATVVSFTEDISADTRMCSAVLRFSSLQLPDAAAAAPLSLAASSSAVPSISSTVRVRWIHTRSEADWDTQCYIKGAGIVLLCSHDWQLSVDGQQQASVQMKRDERDELTRPRVDEFEAVLDWLAALGAMPEASVRDSIIEGMPDSSSSHDAAATFAAACAQLDERFHVDVSAHSYMRSFAQQAAFLVGQLWQSLEASQRHGPGSECPHVDMLTEWCCDSVS